jgi:hypothetical protein
MAVQPLLVQLEKGKPLPVKSMIVKYTGPASYATGGDPLTPAQLGLTEILFVDIACAGGSAFEYDYANQKVIAYRTGSGNQVVLSEVPAATNLSAQTARILILGN